MSDMTVPDEGYWMRLMPANGSILFNVRKNASGLHDRPPGLDSPRSWPGYSVWQVEQNPQTGTWRPMGNALSWHLEECYTRGLAATAVTEDGVHYYCNLTAMCRRNAMTGANRRIRRWIV